MNDFTATLTSALEQMKPMIAEEFEALVRRRVAEFRDRFLMENGRFSRDAYNSHAGAAMHRSLAGYISLKTKDVRDDIGEIAARYADDVFAAMIGKLSRKIGAVDSVTSVTMYGHDQFTVVATMGDRTVRVQQSRIINVSPKGKPFHQWPARIYVDGAAISEAKFKKLAA